MRKTWMERTLAGETVNIDDEISAWHECPETPLPHLNRWLGMTGEEYAVFVNGPEALPAIVGRRATKERAAWARLVRAVEIRWREDIQGAAQAEYLREIGAAKADLRAVGVDVDALLRDG